jgi:hypothetical protein
VVGNVFFISKSNLGQGTCGGKCFLCIEINVDTMLGEVGNPHTLISKISASRFYNFSVCLYKCFLLYIVCIIFSDIIFS